MKKKHINNSIAAFVSMDAAVALGFVAVIVAVIIGAATQNSKFIARNSAKGANMSLAGNIATALNNPTQAQNLIAGMPINGCSPTSAPVDWTNSNIASFMKPIALGTGVKITSISLVNARSVAGANPNSCFGTIAIQTSTNEGNVLPQQNFMLFFEKSSDGSQISKYLGTTLSTPEFCLSTGGTWDKTTSTCSIASAFGKLGPVPNSPCGAQTLSNCILPLTGSGSTTPGSCASGFTGSCNYSCKNGVWTSLANSCSGASSQSQVFMDNFTCLQSTASVVQNSVSISFAPPLTCAVSCTSITPTVTANQIDFNIPADLGAQGETCTLHCTGVDATHRPTITDTQTIGFTNGRQYGICP